MKKWGWQNSKIAAGRADNAQPEDWLQTRIAAEEQARLAQHGDRPNQPAQKSAQQRRAGKHETASEKARMSQLWSWKLQYLHHEHFPVEFGNDRQEDLIRDIMPHWLPNVTARVRSSVSCIWHSRVWPWSHLLHPSCGQRAYASRA